MSLVDTLLEQHRQLLVHVREVESALKAKEHERDPFSVLRPLGLLKAKLAVHVAAETNSLLPLLRSTATGRDAAERFDHALAELTSSFASFIRAWSAPAIAGEPVRFAFEARELFAELTVRLRDEEADTYPLTASPLAA